MVTDNTFSNNANVAWIEAGSGALSLAGNSGSSNLANGFLISGYLDSATSLPFQPGLTYCFYQFLR